MALSRVDLYNQALGYIKVGARVSHVNDDVTRTYLLPQSWDFVLSQILSRHEWKFATVNRKLAKAGDGPDMLDISSAAAYRWNWVYPADCRKLIRVGRLLSGRQANTILYDFATNYPWDTEAGAKYGRVIKTMHDHACAQYITDSVPEVYWPGAFANAFCWALAAQITRGINASDSDADYRMKQAEHKFLVAQSADIEEQGMGLQRNGDWIESREMHGDQPIGDRELFGAHIDSGPYLWGGML